MTSPDDGHRHRLRRRPGVGMGEWDDAVPADGTPAAGAARAAIDAAITGLDVKAAVAQAVGVAMQRSMDAIAAAAVDEFLEPLMPELREAADDAARQALDAPPDTGADENPPEPYFPDLMTFVKDYLAPIYRALSGSSVTWGPEWWKHAEAIARLEALWRAWEFLPFSDMRTAGQRRIAPMDVGFRVPSGFGFSGRVTGCDRDRRALPGCADPPAPGVRGRRSGGARRPRSVRRTARLRGPRHHGRRTPGSA